MSSAYCILLLLPYRILPRGGKKAKDPNEPKRPISAYFIFNADNREATKKENPGATTADLTKKLAEKWNALGEAAKKPYEEKAAALKKQYEIDLAEYKKSH